jgi:cytochrome d ubiquinol oxidase subunit II
VLTSLIFYLLMGGADYGGGMWDLLASGARAQRQGTRLVKPLLSPCEMSEKADG